MSQITTPRRLDTLPNKTLIEIFGHLVDSCCPEEESKIAPACFMANQRLYEAAKQALFGGRELQAMYRVDRYRPSRRQKRLQLRTSHLTSFQLKPLFYQNVQRLRIQLWGSLMLAEASVAREIEWLIFCCPKLDSMVVDYGQVRNEEENRRAVIELDLAIGCSKRLQGRKLSILLERNFGTVFDRRVLQ